MSNERVLCMHACLCAHTCSAANSASVWTEEWFYCTLEIPLVSLCFLLFHFRSRLLTWIYSNFLFLFIWSELSEKSGWFVSEISCYNWWVYSFTFHAHIHQMFLLVLVRHCIFPVTEPRPAHARCPALVLKAEETISSPFFLVSAQHCFLCGGQPSKQKFTVAFQVGVDQENNH